MEVRSYGCDASDTEQVTATFNAIIEAFGAVDILVNNAGITRDGLLMRMKDADFDDVIRVNLRSVFVCARHLPPFDGTPRGPHHQHVECERNTRPGGRRTMPLPRPASSGITKTNAMETRGRGITVNAVAPGFIQTDMTAKLPPETIEKFKAAIPAQS